MKKSCIILIVLFFMVNFAGSAKSQLKNTSQKQLKVYNFSKIKITFNDSWFGRDKAHHFLTSAFLATSGYYYCREEKFLSGFHSQQGAICFSISLGLFKEVKDGLKPGNVFSFQDLIADVLGTALGVVLISK